MDIRATARFFTCRTETLTYVGGMASGDPDEKEILEVIDQRRPTAHPLKYIVLGIVGLAFVVCGYRLMLHFTPRAVVGAACRQAGEQKRAAGHRLRLRSFFWRCFGLYHAFAAMWIASRTCW